MRGEYWVGHLVFGGLVMAAAAAWTHHVWQQRGIEDRPVVQRTVAESLDAAGESPRLVELRDLVVECERMVSVDGRVHAPAHGEGWWDDPAVVEVTPGEDCEGVVERAHVIDVAPPSVSAQVLASRAVEARVDVVRARRFRADGSYALTVGLLLIGASWVLAALAMRREYVAALAEALARAAAPKRRAEAAATTSRGVPYRGTSERARLLPWPLKLRSRSLRDQRRRGLAMGAIGGVLLSITLGFVGSRGHDLVVERDQWDHGVRATEISASGDLRVHLLGVFESGDFGYVFYDAQRRPHVGERSLLSMLGDVGEREFEVRYDPQDPRRHAIAWIGEHTTGLWMALVVVAAVGIGLAIAAWVVARRALATPQRWRRVLQEPEEVELRVVSRVEQVHRGSATGATKYVFSVPGSDQPVEYLAPDPSLTPFFLDLDGTRALGLRNPKQPGMVMVLCADLSPLDIDPEAEQGIRARIREAARAEVTAS